MVAVRRWAYELEQKLGQAPASAAWNTARFETTFKAAARHLARQAQAPSAAVNRVLLKLEATWHAHLAHVGPQLRTQDVDMTEVSLGRG